MVCWILTMKLLQIRSSSSVLMPGATCSPIMSSTSAASAPATRSFSCSSRDLIDTWWIRNMGAGAFTAKALFRREVHGIKRGLFWQRNPHAHQHLRPGVDPAKPPTRRHGRAGAHSRIDRRSRMRGGHNPHKEFDYVRRLYETDAGSGRPFRTSDPLLEPEDGPLYLRRTKPYSHH